MYEMMIDHNGDDEVMIDGREHWLYKRIGSGDGLGWVKDRIG